MKRSAAIFFLLTASISVFSQREKPADVNELKEITERGKNLAEYDVAAWHSTDAVLALSPKEHAFNGFIAKKNGPVWTVVYGKLNDKKDKYLIVYEAVQQSSPVEFKVQFFDRPKEDSGFFLRAANAIETAKAAFVPAEKRPYNVAVLSGKEGQFLIYFVPAQTRTGIFPLGGDCRFTISQDGSKILQSRQLHKSIIEFQAPKGETPVSGYHTAILDDIPEDTDVFHVLAREPKVPELIVTQKFVYNVGVDGTIRYLMTTEAFKKIGKN
jgi:hypothetical protein